MEINPLSVESQPPARYTQPSAIRFLLWSLTGWYRRHEKHAGVLIFCLGFLWDSLTLTGVDNLVDNLILLSYVIVIGFLIVLTVRKQSELELPKWIQKAEPHLAWVMQFLFGGLFSSYVVFYFASVSWTKTQVFFVILILLWIGNEFLQHRLQNLNLLAALYCFCIFSFLAFFLPVITARMSPAVFLAAGLISLAVTFSVFSIGLLGQAEQWKRCMPAAGACMFITFASINLLYFADLIPPVPLALKSAGIYHHVKRTPSGYQVKYVPPPSYRFWKQWDDPFYLSPGESVFCYTAVFAPRNIRVPVVHVWSRKTRHGWVKTDRISFEISGGRRAGYRGFTVKRGITPGKWRVELQTERGQILGRIDFKVVTSPDPHPPLITRLIR